MIRPDSSIDSLANELVVENRELRQRLDTVYRSYVRLMSKWDCAVGALQNENISAYNFRMYLSLIQAHPELLDGDETDFQVKLIRAGAGGISKTTATRFFQDMQAIGAFDYDSGEQPSKMYDVRIGHLKPNPAIFPHPETFDTERLDRKRKAKEAEAKRKSQFIDPRKINTCENCGSSNLVYALVPSCLDCLHVHQTIENVPASALTIEAEIIEVADEFDRFLDEQPTAKIPVVRPAPVQALLPEPALPPMPDAPCRKCGRPRKVCFRQGEEGLWWNSCQ